MQLEHDSGKIIYRNPLGACPVGTKVKLSLSVRSYSIPESVYLFISGQKIPMYFSFEQSGSRMYECLVEMPQNPTLVFYYFSASADGETLFYGNNSLCLGGMGESYVYEPQKHFQLTVYKKDFHTPDWMKNAIVYQIFPDRFYRSGNTPFHGIERNWGEEPFYLPEQFGGEYLSNDFFGGNFEGIRKKLPYLQDLGITAIYLNPIGKAFSNHRYDTGDYETPDETLGTTEDFKKLSLEAEKLGIKIILDGVFSHTGADSRYFNKYGHYASIGAYQGEESPYYSWYNFTHFPDKYDSWWGFDTLPNVNELDENFVSYIAKNKDSVIKKWLRMGASGFRLDVADELPDEFISILRKELKEEKEDALLIGEVWEDASNKESYGKRRRFLLGEELDSVMNYVFRSALLSYLKDGDASLFSMRLASLLENYPLEALYSAMNLISSHDVPRALTSLSDAPSFRSLSRKEQHDYVIPPEKLSLAKRRMVLAIALQMTLPGAPTIYYGDEIAMTGYADPFNRAPMDWEKEECEITRQMKLFTKLRNENMCLRTGFYTLLYYKDGVICFMRSIENKKDVFGKEGKNKSMIILVNAKDCHSTVNLSLDRFFVTGITDSLSGEVISTQHTLSLTMEPLSYRVFNAERTNEKCIKIQSI